MNIKITLFSLFAFATWPELLANETNLVRIAELEGICGAPPSCNVEDAQFDPTPTNILAKYGISRRQLVDDLIFISNKYSVNETNEDNRTVRDMAICYVGQYGDSGDLSYLSSIMTNKNDFARETAFYSSLSISNGTTNFIVLVNEAFNPENGFSKEFQDGFYVGLYEYWKNDTNKNSNQCVFIAHFFLESAATCGWNLFVDRCACEMNPSYRHSQARRDNLSRNRPPNLTGEQAEIYDARQRDAMEPES